jgi:hypothetical protein
MIFFHGPVQHNHQMPIVIFDMLFKLSIFPPSIVFLNPKCALWDCPIPTQGSNERLVYCSQFWWRIGTEWRCSRHVPHIEAKWDWFKGYSFAALTSYVNGWAISILELHGVATSKMPWNVTSKPYSLSKFYATSCSMCSKLCHIFLQSLFVSLFWW